VTPVRVAVVDDSLFVRSSVDRLLAEDPRLRFVGSAASGEEFIERCAAWDPEVVILDLAMPGMGGQQTLEWIMRHRPTPVIILSTSAEEAEQRTLRALEAGAVDFVDKRDYSLVDFAALRATLIERILRAAHAWRRAPAPAERATSPAQPPAEPGRAFRILAVGASVGGPPAIRRLLDDLGRDARVPIVLVQHMHAQFLPAFARHLADVAALPVSLAADGEPLRAGHAYVAPGGHQLAVAARDGALVARFRPRGSAVHCPSVDALFEACAEALGAETLAVLLTGMGEDGARGMQRIAASGGHTIAQDRESSVVYGMPFAAVQRGGVSEELPLAEIGPRVLRLLG
jgi:two-component system chemotaxis response regulator CheB